MSVWLGKRIFKALFIFKPRKLSHKDLNYFEDSYLKQWKNEKRKTNKKTIYQ